MTEETATTTTGVRAGSTTSFTVPMEEVVEWRRHLHAHPELSFREFETADFIEELLREWGITTVRLTPTSVIGTIAGTAGDPETGRVVGFRADIDALPVQEETGLEFASRNPGVMHACGHDVHTAMLLGTAKILQSMRDQLHGKVVCIFQHAEESLPGGARELVAAGAADELDEVYAFHVAPHPVGHVGICRGRVSTMSGIVSIGIRGRGGHSSNPQLSVDPVLVASEATMLLNTIVSRNLDPRHMNIVNVGALHSGEVGNVIPDTARLEVSIRSVDESDWESICHRIETLVNGVCAAHGAQANFEWQIPYPMVVNADRASDRAWHAAVKAIGEHRVFAAEPWSPSDDFSYFSREVPGCYMFLGGGGPEVGMPFFLHNSRFDVVERAMNAGVRVEVQIALDALAPGFPAAPEMPQDCENRMEPAGTLPPRPVKPGFGTPQSKAAEVVKRKL
ncbi:M20 metallopeptidase family protein [Corynebacterium sp. H78]|uniref:M20 metallopeptidase family protein n=1 Tax=Corynebacterium sp. H78 TaxID=3133417 RepID=UPI0030B4DA0C